MNKKVKTSLLAVILLFIILFLLKTPNSHDNTQRPQTIMADLSKIIKGQPIFMLEESHRKMDRDELEVFPSWNGSYDPFGIDLRSYDISKYNLSNYKKELEYAVFDTNTIWPNDMPSGFDPQKILELGKNPGLGIDLLHKQGITGKGVNIAIIDTALLLTHDEYRENIMLYELSHCLDDSAQMHGSAVVSVAVGKNVGVAPDAKVYYIASTFGTISPSGAELDLSYMAEGIKRVLEINSVLPDDEKIRVISISTGIEPLAKGYTSVVDAIELAKEEGVFVITTTPQINYDISITGMGRGLYDDPDDVQSYSPGILWSKDYTYYSEDIEKGNLLMVPMDSKTYAFCTGNSDYAFSRQGGLSFTCPWLAGMYALCAQVKPDITPEEFINISYETGSTIKRKQYNQEVNFGIIINPVNIINKLITDR